MTPTIIHSEETKRWADENGNVSATQIVMMAAKAGVAISDYNVARMANGIFILAHDKQGDPVYAMTYNDKGETECVLVEECDWICRLRGWINMKPAAIR